MPIYIFSNPENENETVEVVQSVNDEHIYTKDGVKWNRVFTVPTASVDSTWNPDDPKDFVEKTKNKKGSIGNLMDKSEELSARRKSKYGIDPVKEKFYKRYAEERAGREHPDVKKRKLKERLEKTPFVWED